MAVDVVADVGVGVEGCSDSVAAVFADDRVSPRFSERFDRFGDPLQRFERADRGDAAQGGFASRLDEAGERVDGVSGVEGCRCLWVETTSVCWSSGADGEHRGADRLA